MRRGRRGDRAIVTEQDRVVEDGAPVGHIRDPSREPEAKRRRTSPDMDVLGADGDVAIWDPNLTKKIRDEDVLSNGKFSIFNGWEVTGWPIITIRRGEVAYRDGKILAEAGSGHMAPRQRWQRP